MAKKKCSRTVSDLFRMGKEEAMAHMWTCDHCADSWSAFCAQLQEVQKKRKATKKAKPKKPRRCRPIPD